MSWLLACIIASACASLPRRLRTLEQLFDARSRDAWQLPAVADTGLQSRDAVAELLDQRTPRVQSIDRIDSSSGLIQRRWPEQSVEQADDWSEYTPAALRLRSAEGGPARQLLGGPTCSNHSTCGVNEYCMNCTKCRKYHESMSRDQQKRWTCDPCVAASGGHCESGRYCTRAGDSQSGTCPAFPGCRTHSECPQNEYCFSCSKCHRYIAETGKRDELWECEPCPTPTGGFCGLIAWCSLRKDSIDGQCPRQHGCDSHEDCWNSQYCEDCTGCIAYRDSLPANQRAYWSCGPCPTVGGGICSQLRFCQVANDGMGGTCPRHRGCTIDNQCLPDEYCSDCTKCETHRDTLPIEQQGLWACDPCPTRRGGSCHPRQFCLVANDPKEGKCPPHHGCGAHTDCGKKEFCLSWEACKNELGSSCGAKPSKGGLCFRAHLCQTERSIDGHCPIPPTCGNHGHCSPGYFCAPWSDCVRRDPTKCGPRPFHREGVCLLLQHCTSGLHSSLDGTCPVNRTRGGVLRVRQGLNLNGSLQLATHHQALNTWKFGDKHPLVANLRDIRLYVGSDPPRGTVSVVFHRRPEGPNGTDVALEISYKVSGLEKSSSGGLHIHMGTSCSQNRAIGGHFWANEGSMPDPWDVAKWVSNESGIAEGSFTVVNGYDYKQNSGRAVVLHASDGNKIACGTLAEELVVTQLHDFGNMNKRRVHDDLEFVGIYSVSSGQLREDRREKLSCPAVEITVPSKAGFFFEARIHLTDLEMSSRHAECSCVKSPRNASQSCLRGAHISGIASNRSFARTVSQLHPVLFLRDGGVATSNKLTLYSLTQNVTAPAVLVDSSLGGGEGDPSLGCPWLNALEPKIHPSLSLQDLRAAGKVMPAGHVGGSWCAVRLGAPGAMGCSVTAKYKFCAASGAIGVILVQEKGVDDDYVANIALLKDKISDLIPVICMRHDDDFLTALQSNTRPIVAVGPDIAGKPSINFIPSDGGIRVYDVAGNTWYHYKDVFRSQEWMEYSHVRDVLFVCTSEHELIALDASSPVSGLPVLGTAVGVDCHAAPLFRDYHIADIRRGDKYFTAVVDPSTDSNRIYFFETTDLSSWRKVSELHANWEHDKAGLGQVIAAQEGKYLLITWHCSTLYCGGEGTGDGKSKGERLYVLDLRNIADGQPPAVLSVTNLPMSRGSIIRDIACDLEGICLASLTWDGLVVVDIAEGPNQFQIVAKHSTTFNKASIPEQNVYLRMVAGAQRIAPSQTHPGRFYVEHWSVDVQCFQAGSASTISECVRFDGMWVVDLESYSRPKLPAGGKARDSSVHATLRLRISMHEVLARMPSGKVDDLERMVASALQRALNIDGQRILVTGAKSSDDRQSVLVFFHIVPGTGASPSTLFAMLQRQLEVQGSAIRTGLIAPFTQGAELAQRNARPPGGDDTTSSLSGNGSKNGDGISVHMIIMMVITALCIIITVWALAFAFRAKRAAALAMERANAFTRQNPPPAVAALLVADESPGSDYYRNDHYVTGRPIDGDCSPRYPSRDWPTECVIGNPIDPRRLSAANRASAGLALSNIDTQKLAGAESSDAGGAMDSYSATGNAAASASSSMQYAVGMPVADCEKASNMLPHQLNHNSAADSSAVFDDGNSCFDSDDPDPLANFAAWEAQAAAVSSIPMHQFHSTPATASSTEPAAPQRHQNSAPDLGDDTELPDLL